MHAFAGGHAFD